MATKRDLEALDARRVEGARMLKRGVSQAEVARRLEVSRQSVNRWAQLLEQANGAVSQLKGRSLGRPRRLDAAQCAWLSQALLAGALQAGFPTELWTVKRVRALIKREFNVVYSNTGCWELLRNLGFSPQKPEKRALQRDEQAISTWKREGRTIVFIDESGLSEKCPVTRTWAPSVRGNYRWASFLFAVN